MKTTIDIADGILSAAKRLAASEGTTLRALVEAGLRQVVAQHKERPAPFRLRRASVKGRGLRSDVQGRSWEQLREMAYEGHGA
jgi:succinylarginine dihydrolase